MIQKMIDSLVPPNFTAAKGAGIEWVAGYLGGVGAAGTWSQGNWEAAMATGFAGLIPIWVPTQDAAAYNATLGGQDALVAITAVEAINPGDWYAALTVDIEAGMYNANPSGVAEYCQSWVATLGRHNIPAGVYSVPNGFTGWPAIPALAWVAAPGNDPAWPDANPQPPFGSRYNAWQYYFDATEPYGTVDLSVMDAPTPAPPPAPPALPPQPTRTLTSYTVSDPVRICDTRPGNPSMLSGIPAQTVGHSLTASEEYTLQAVELESIPATALVVDCIVTILSKGTGGLVYTYPPGYAVPTYGDIVVDGAVTQQTRPITVGYDGTIGLEATFDCDVVIDVVGWWI